MERLSNRSVLWAIMLGGMEFFSSMSAKWSAQEFSVLVSNLKDSFYLLDTNITAAGSILRALDSVGLSMLYWVFGAIIAAGKFSFALYSHI